MEKSEEYQIRVQACEKCYEHEHYDHHYEQEYRSAFQTLSQFVSQMNIKILRNVPPKYLRKVADTKNSSKRHIDTNTGKIIEFPTRGSFEVYYKNILLYSKLLVGTFPDLSYLCLIIKQLHRLYLKNASTLASLQKFRDIEYEWKKNLSLAQSLYTYIKLNTCGNNSVSCLIDTLTKYIQNSSKIQNKNNKFSSLGHKRKIVHPYILYDDRQKMHKMESIYCPKGSKMENLALTKRVYQATTSHDLKGNNITKRRPQTGSTSNRYETIINKNFLANEQSHIIKNFTQTPNNAFSKGNNDSYRQAGYIVKNYGSNHIFELVIKQENKQFDEQRWKRWRKQQNLCIDQELQNLKAGTRSHWKSNSHQNIKRIKNTKEKQNIKTKTINFRQKSNRKQDIKIDKTKKVYLAHLDKIKNKMNSKEKFKINLNANETPIENFNTKRSDKESVKRISKTNSNESRFGSIKKNGIDNQDQIKSVHSLNNQELKKEGLQRPGSCTSRNSQRNSKCLKLSRYSKIRKSLEPEYVNTPFEQKQNSPKENLQGEVDSSLASSQKATIEQKTVQKRISQRKRASSHQRYPSLNISRYNTLQREIQFTNEGGYVDAVNSEQNIDPLHQQWQLSKLSSEYVREPAMIVKKFSQQQNFIEQNSYHTKYQKIMAQPYCEQAAFQIKGQELLNKFIVKSIRDIYKPSQIRLFPDLFKQIQAQNPPANVSVSSSQSQSQQAQNSSPHIISKFHESKLIYLVNLMLRSNPMIISRIFQDKKSINPYGVYCIWLRNTFGKLQPVFINDYFPFQLLDNKDKAFSYKPVYSGLANQNSIWYMLLQKAVAKVLGGYHVLNEINLAQLMSILMTSPTVDIGYISPQKALKVFDQKIFYNKMASLYTMRQIISDGNTFKEMKHAKRIDRIIGFSSNKRDCKESAISIKIEQSTVSFSLRQFLLNYGEIAILFFNNNYFINQTNLILTCFEQAVLSCKLVCSHSKNNCYLMFEGFPEKYPTKVSLYRQLTDQQANIKQGMNPLTQQNKRYEYVGQILKTGSFFFQVLLNGGDYICLMENAYQVPPSISLLSEYPVKFGQINCNPTKDTEKQKKKKVKKQNKSKINSKILEMEEQNPTPKILIQHKIPIPQFYDQKINRAKKANKCLKNQVEISIIKINKKYAYQPDNIQSDKENKDKENDKTKTKNKSKLKQHKKRSDGRTTTNLNNSQNNRLDVSENYSKVIDMQKQQKPKFTSSFVKQPNICAEKSPIVMSMCSPDSNLNKNINRIIDLYD